MEIKLPKKKSAPTYVDPHIMLLYGPPKVGKTTLISQLPNCLTLDLEDGTKYLNSMRMQIIGLEPPVNENKDVKVHRYEEEKYYLTEAGRAIHEAGLPYKYVALDTATKLEEWCVDHGTKLYMSSPIGKNFNRTSQGNILPQDEWDSVLTLANGAGYMWLRQSMKLWLDKIYTLSPHIILIAHLLDKMIEKKGKEVSAKDIDLTGKLKRIVCAQADAIGYLYRRGDEMRINFQSSDQVNCGSRCEHLKGQDFEFDWKLIYKQLN